MDSKISIWRSKPVLILHLQSLLTYLARYERFERVDMGDFNWITPSFVAFASPQYQPVNPIPQSSPSYSSLPTCIPEIAAHAKLSQPFKNVLTHFVNRNVGLVVRLNSELYCPTFFTALGIEHIDMIFEDGTCPSLPVVHKFIKLAHEMINIKKRGIAVHCKAGLGRTGCLIGAYLIYRHGFTANEVIAFMRFMRPGMVVGPQQHWLHLNQGTFREWWLEDQIKAKLNTQPSTPKRSTAKTSSRFASNGQIATPPNGSTATNRTPRSALGEIEVNESNAGPQNYCQDENLPAPTPGQPRKAQRMDSRSHPYARSASAGHQLSNTHGDRPGTEVVTMKAHRQSQSGNESEEEYTLRMLAEKRSQSRSPNGKKRAVSYTTTTTTTTRYDSPGIWEDSTPMPMNIDQSRHMGAEQQIWEDLAQESGQRPKTPKGSSGSGTLGLPKQRKESPGRRRSGGEEKGRVRKTSSRVGSANTGPVGVSGRGR